ncbi:MAG: hypothetical protein ACRDNW_22135 [Trebonia sp.]
MNASMTHNASAAHPVREVAGLDRIRGRSHEELADATEFLAWYAPRIFTAVLDYMDAIDGELIPGRG